jgi:putative endonuclease
MGKYFTYIVTNRKNGPVYTGMTNNIVRRVWQHKRRVNRSFTKRYNLDKLVWYESFPTPLQAIRREKQIKGWIRSKKIALIEKENPEWNDLYNSLVSPEENPFGRMS